MSLNNTPRILVIDDEQDLAQLISYNLKREGYQVHQAYNGREALEKIYELKPDLLILDVMLPDKSGIELCKWIKTEYRDLVPIVPRVMMLTARTAEWDRIQGFESGADDYITKPFSPRELVLRVHAMLDRHFQSNQRPNSPKEVMTNGALVINPEALTVHVAGQELRLTPIEFRLLYTLAVNLNMTRTREQLLEEVWEGEAADILDRTVDAHMKRLRAKLGEAKPLLQTIRGMGYRLVSPDRV
jgi:two-component system, OmpR family, phosphate regulon response regulator PhoB